MGGYIASLSRDGIYVCVNIKSCGFNIPVVYLIQGGIPKEVIQCS